MTEKELYDSLSHQNGMSLDKQDGLGINRKERMLNDALPVLMRKVYVWMTLALAITGVVAWGVASSPALLTTIFSNTMVFFGLCIAELALVMWLSARINKLSLQTATILFILYAIINGVTLSCIFLAYTTSSIAKVFFITSGTFAAMSLYGYVTKKDLSSIGKILIFALIGLVIAHVVNMFTKSSQLDYYLSYAGVIIFMGLTAWDTHKIKKTLKNYAYDLSEASQKIALLGALSLYLDFINLFIYLLRILGSRNN